MKRLIYAWLFVVAASYLYGLAAYQYQDGIEIFGCLINFLYIFFAPMVIFESVLIWHLGKSRVPKVTGIFIFVLSMSITLHTLGALAWVTYNDLGLYNSGRQIILALELLVITGGLTDQYISGRHRKPYYDRVPSMVVMAEIDE